MTVCLLKFKTRKNAVLLTVLFLATLTAPVADAASCNFSRVLKRGSSGDDVRALQEQLVAKKFLSNDSTTGYFGVLTERALQQLQKNQGIIKTGTPATTGFGLFGPRTREAVTNFCVTASQVIQKTTQAPSAPSVNTPIQSSQEGARPWWFNLITITPGFGAAGPAQNSPLAVSINGTQTVAEGTALVLSSLAVTGGRAPYTYLWDFGDATTSILLTPVHSYADNGNYTVSILATDTASTTRTASMTVTVTNVAPVPNIGGPYTGTAGLAVSFTGSATDAGSADTSAGFTYAWDFGNGATSSSQNPSYTYPAAGTYTVSLTVTDKDGGSASTTTTATIESAPLNVSLAASVSVAEGSNVPLGSFSVTGGTAPYTYAWTFGDGATSTSATPTHAYADNGSFTTTITITDAALVTSSATMNVTVTNALPVVNAHGAYTGTTASTLAFTGSATDAGSADTSAGLTYAWDFGNGATSTAQNPSYTYVVPGTYTITLTVTDKDGGIGTNATTATISGNAVMLPGGGWSGATTQPGAVGTPGTFGYNDNTIAQWDVVPNQTFSGSFPVGVVAFHNTGIDHVAFAVNGGAWTNVTTSSTNASTGVNEFWADVRASDFSDGRIEIRAIAYPHHGVPRLMSTSLYLNANQNSTLPGTIKYVATTGSDTTGTGTVGNPYATISKAVAAINTAQASDVGGGVIYLQAGSYAYGAAAENFTRNAATQWLTISAAPGVSANDAIIASVGSSAGVRTQKVHLKNLTINGPTIPTNSGISGVIWLDNVTYIGPGRTVANSQPVSGTSVWTGGIYVTDSNISQSANGVISAKLVRGTNVHDIGSDSFQSSQAIINCTSSNIDASGTSFHPDVFQINGAMSNVIVYGLTATSGIQAQGVFSDTVSPITDMAMVNTALNNQNPITTSSYVFQFGSATTNLFVKDSGFTGPAIWRTDQNFVGTDVVVENTTFSSSPGAVAGVTYR